MSDKLANVYYEVGYKVDDSGLVKADDNLKKVGEKVKATKVDSEGLGSSFGSIATKAAAFVAVAATVATLATGINKATNQFAEFDYQLTKVNAKGDQTTKSYNILKEAAFEAGKATVFSSTQSAKALEYMAMAGWSAVDSAKALPAVLDTAVVAGEDLSLVSDIITDQMTVFKLGANQAGHFADVLAYSANKSNTSIGMMGEAMKYAAPPMATLGSGAEEVAAIFMSMADGGIKASIAGTSLRTAALRLVSPSKEATKVMKKLRIETKDGNKQFVGMTSILEQLEEKTRGMTNVQKAQVLETLFGKEAVTGIMVALEQGTKKIKANTEALKTNNGYARKSAEYMSQTLQGQILATASKQEALSLKIGETFAPAKLELVKTYNGLLDSMLDKLTKSTDETQKLSDFTVGFIDIMTEGMKFVGKAIEDAVILPLKFVGNTLDILTLGQFSKASNAFVQDVAEVGERKRAEQEFSRTQLEKLTEKPFVPLPGAPARQKEKPLTELAGFNTGSTTFAPAYNFGDINVNVPAGTDINDPSQLGSLFRKSLKEELDLRDKKMLNQINPKKRRQ